MKAYYAVHKDKTHVKVDSPEDFAARFSNSTWTLVEADSEGWIAHTGKECPLPDDCLCEVWVKGAKRPFALENPQKQYWSELFSYRPILDGVPAAPAKLTTNTLDLLGTLSRAHEAAQTIPDLEAELREVLASMGYDLVSRNPFAQQPHGAGVTPATRSPV
jgi:hypothetical protein